jgi:hypothetical protein
VNQAEAQPVDAAPARGRPSLLLIVALIVVVGISFLLGRQLVGVLVTVLSPPDAPLPEGASVVSHDNQGHGVDDWTLSVPVDACTATQFYIDNGAQCVVSPLQCGTGSGGLTSDAAMIARCYGQYDVSIFSLRYEAIIGRGNAPDVSTVRIVREMLWSGAGSNTGTTPEATSAP